MKAEKKRVYECKISNTGDETGIYAMSFVDYPANESNFVALKRAAPQRVALNRQKQILTGVVLRPEQLIYRYDEQLGEYYIKFSAADIEAIAIKMMKSGLALNNTTHQHERPLSGNFLCELWIVKDSKKDKAVALGLGELPAGTLVASYKVESAKYWRDEVLSGNVKGFSLEGFFNLYKFDFSMNKNKQKPAGKKAAASKKQSFRQSLASAIVSALLSDDTAAETDDLADVAADDETNSGTPVLIFPLAEGGEIWIDAEGYATIDGDAAAPEGEHPLSDGNVITIDAEGKFVETADEATGEEAVVTDADLAQARARGNALLKKTGKTAEQLEIERLKAENAKLKGQPTRKKVQQKATATGANDEPLTFSEQLGSVITQRRAALKKQ